MSKKHYYAAVMPRGFSNEENTYAFSSQKARDKFISEYPAEDYGKTGRYAVSRRVAMKNVHYKGDAITQSYNGSMRDGDAELQEELFEKQRKEKEFSEPCPPGEEYVSPYYKKDGTYVEGHCRDRRWENE